VRSHDHVEPGEEDQLIKPHAMRQKHGAGRDTGSTERVEDDSDQVLQRIALGTVARPLHGLVGRGPTTGCFSRLCQSGENHM
jgi:hypothetical protein